MTATMIAWPKDCGHEAMALELVEHHRPYWRGRRTGHRPVSAAVPAPGCVLSTGLALANPCGPGPIDGTAADLAAWASRPVTLLRYAGCVLVDAEIERARQAGLDVEVVDVDGGARSEWGPD
jgi:hypothetical protein